jgi:alkanesulfonate monooxygenase SsuD/methylene tetrahydromethanopterin reductase-like flavin-dependent oxidoreductase (luciferase family)
MHVSLQFSPQSRAVEEDLRIIETVVEQAVLADTAGIASISLTEHHLGGFNTYSDPFLMGCYLAPRLEQVYLAVMVVQVPLAHPLRIAEQANMLDLVTRGRCLVALASGSPRSIELDSFGVAADQRSNMTEQRIQAAVRAWAWEEEHAPVDISTAYDRGVIGARVTPSSFRQPHPLIARATGSDTALLDCARRGWPAVLATSGDPTPESRRQANLYREALESAGHDEATVAECRSWLGPITMLSVAETEQKAKRRFDQYIEVGGAGPIVTSPDVGTQAWAEEWRLRIDQRASATFCGTPEMVVEYLHKSADYLDSNHVRAIFIDTPGEEEQNMESYRLFLDEVLPALNPEPLAGPTQTLGAAPTR